MTDFCVGHVTEPTHPHSIYERVQVFIDIYADIYRNNYTDIYRDLESLNEMGIPSFLLCYPSASPSPIAIPAHAQGIFLNRARERQTPVGSGRPATCEGEASPRQLQCTLPIHTTPYQPPFLGPRLPPISSFPRLRDRVHHGCIIVILPIGRSPSRSQQNGQGAGPRPSRIPSRPRRHQHDSLPVIRFPSRFSTVYLSACLVSHQSREGREAACV